jgi:uncharacterized membrane protein YebE (DUF533 family)
MPTIVLFASLVFTLVFTDGSSIQETFEFDQAVCVAAAKDLHVNESKCVDIEGDISELELDNFTASLIDAELKNDIGLTNVIASPFQKVL